MYRFDPWVRKILWSRKCNPLQYSCLENSTDRGDWQGIVHGGHKELDMTRATEQTQLIFSILCCEISQYWDLLTFILLSVSSAVGEWLILCDPMDCSPPGSSVHRILQARILEWVAIPFSRGSSLSSY